jgi:dTDP-4-dehydrorhamnose 3,5-epimerase
MIFTPTELAGVFLIEPERREDERGFFARTFCEEELAVQGIAMRVAQSSISFNQAAGTLRGLHFQMAPHGETKLVRCTLGGIYDVVVDLRPTSPTYCRWVAAQLTSENRRLLYIPEGCAHGFLTLGDATEVFYEISTPYEPSASAGVRWNDPAFGVVWPAEPAVISGRDAAYPDYLPDAAR